MNYGPRRVKVRPPGAMAEYVSNRPGTPGAPKQRQLLWAGDVSKLNAAAGTCRRKPYARLADVRPRAGPPAAGRLV